MPEETKPFLEKFTKLGFAEIPEETFLEIIDKSHLENNWSRILAFYFQPDNRHGMGDFLIKALFDALKLNNLYSPSRRVSVQIELQTKNNKRIDIVLKTNNHVIGIENKINAPLYNDLSEYGDKIKKLIDQDQQCFLIVLSKNKADFNEQHQKHLGKIGVRFANLTYETFLAAMRLSFDEVKMQANLKYGVFFVDFMDNIERNLNLINMINNEGIMKFFTENYEDVQKVVRKNDQINREIVNYLNLINNEILKNEEIRQHFQECLGNDIFELNTGTDFKGDERALWVSIKNKNNKKKVIECVLYNEKYYWYAETTAVDEYKQIYQEDFSKPEFCFDKVEPWTNQEALNEKFKLIILNMINLLDFKKSEINYLK